MAGVSKSEIEEGFEVFAADGQPGVGAVRRLLSPDQPELVIYIENAGDFRIPLDAIREVHSQKVILDLSKLDHKLQHAIRHAHDVEDPDIASRTA